MKKLLLLTIIIAIIGTIHGQNEQLVFSDVEFDFVQNNSRSTSIVSIGTGTGNSSIPIMFSQRNTYSQSIYLAEEINSSTKLIRSISYNFNGQNYSANNFHREWKIFMGNTDINEFPNNSSFISDSDLIEVFYGQVGFAAGVPGWFQIPLDAPFLYESGKNLVIAIYKESGDQPTGPTTAFFYSTPNQLSNRSIRWYNSDLISPFNIYNDPPVPLGNRYVASSIPNIRIEMDNIPSGPFLAMSTQTVKFPNTMANKPVLSTIKLSNIGIGDLELSFDLPQEVTIINNTNNLLINQGTEIELILSYTSSNEGIYNKKIHISSNAVNNNPKIGAPDHLVFLNGNITPENTVQVGTGTVTINYDSLPWDKNYRYSYSQSIFYPNDLNLVNGSLINTIAFQYDGTETNTDLIKLLIGYTNNDEYIDQWSWLPETDLDVYFDGLVQNTNIPYSMTTINLQYPFAYNPPLGKPNLVIATFNYSDTSTGTNMNNRYYTTATTNNRSIYRAGNTPQFSPYNPEFGTTVTRIPNIRFTISQPTISPQMNTAITIPFWKINLTKPITGEMVIRNDGLAPLSINSFNTHQDVIVMPSSQTIQPGDFYSFDVTLSPSTLGLYSTVVTINSNAGNSPIRDVLVTATVYPRGTTEIDDIEYVSGTIIIGDDWSWVRSSSTPFSFDTPNSISQTIYLEEEVNNGHMLITEIGYDYYGFGNIPNNNFPVSIYMTTVPASQNRFPTTSSWIPFSQFTKVFEGILPLSPSGFQDVVIPLDIPFEYQNGNLVIMTHSHYSTINYPYNSWQSTTTQTGYFSTVFRVIQTLNNNTLHNIEQVHTYASERHYARPNIRLQHIDLDNPAPPEPAIEPYPAHLATDVEIDVVLRWSSALTGNRPTGYKIYFGITQIPDVEVASIDSTSWNPNTSLAYDTTYYWQIIPYDNDDEAVNCPIWEFTTMSPPPIFSIYPESFDFEYPFVGTSSDPVTFTITNIGGSVLIVDNVYIASVSDFALLPFDNNLPWTLIAGESATFEAVFSPLAWGYQSAYIFINDNVTREPHQIFIDGVGNYPLPSIAFNPNPLDNSINIPVDQILSWSYIPVKDSRTGFELYFGTSIDSLVWITEDEAFDTPYWIPQVPLEYNTTYYWKVVPFHVGGLANNPEIWSFSTIALPPSIGIDNNMLDFGNVLVGTSINRTITLTNTGGLDLLIETITISGSDQNEFVLFENGFPWTIEHDGTKEIVIQFHPTSIGSKTSTLSITHNGATSTTDISLVGNGVVYNPIKDLLVNIVTIPSNGIELSWSTPDNNHYGEIVSYKILRNGILIDTTITENFLDTDIVPDTGYRYSVITVYDNPTGESLPVSTKEVYIPIYNPPLNLQASVNKPLSVSLKWDPPISQNYGTVVGYKIYRNGEELPFVITTTAIDYLDITDAGDYEYYVTAMYSFTGNDEFNHESEPSNSVIGTSLPENYYPPISIIATLVEGNISIEWTPPVSYAMSEYLIGYNLYRCFTLGANQLPLIIETEELSYLYTNMNVDALGMFFVEAVYEYLDVKHVSTRVYTSIIIPIYNQVQNLTATLNLSGVSVDLLWTEPIVQNYGKVSGYKIKRNGILIAETNSLSFEDTSAPIGSLITYEVIAVYGDLDGESDPEFAYITIIPLPGFAINPNPGNNTLAIPLNQVFHWVANPNGGIPTGYKIFFGETPNSLVEVEHNLSTTFWTHNSLVYGMTYYWKVVPFNTTGDAIDCPIWTFTVALAPPLMAINPIPIDLSTGIETSPLLNWSQNPVGSVPSGYKLFFGSTNPPVVLYNLGNVRNWIPPTTLVQGMTYYWKVVPYNTTGDAIDCPVWSFTTTIPVPNPAVLVNPINHIYNVPMTVELNWLPSPTGGTPTGYKLYFGTNSNPTILHNLGDATSWIPVPTVLPGVKYYWKVVPFNDSGDAVNCPVWDFTVVRQVPLFAENPSPINNSVEVALNQILRWTPNASGVVPVGYKVYFGTNNPPTILQTTITQTSWIPTTPLQYNQTYFWKIVPFNEYGDAINCPVWTFTSNQGRPNIAVIPYPVHDSHNVPLTLTYTWQRPPVGAMPTGYRVYFGTATAPNQTVVTLDVPTWSPNQVLLPNTLYTWRVVPFNQYGDALGSTIWRFTTGDAIPNIATNPTPVNGATNVAINQVLNWTAPLNSGNILGYKLYIDTINPPEIIYTLGNINGWTPPTLFEYGTTYYWQIVPFNAIGDAIGGQTWMFTTIPAIPDFVSNPTPIHGAQDIPINPTLSWSASTTGGTPTSYTIYFGDMYPPIKAQENLVNTTWSPPLPLDHDTVYYWYIIPENISGFLDDVPIWTFKTIEQPSAFVITPFSHDFGYVPIFTTSDILTVTFENTSSSTVVIDGIMVETAFFDFDMIEGAHFDTVFTPGEIKTLNLLAFSPQIEGRQTAEIKIWYDSFSSVHHISVRGTGVSLTPPNNFTANTISGVVYLSWDAQIINESSLVGYKVLRNGTTISTTTSTEYIDYFASYDEIYSYSIITVYGYPIYESNPTNTIEIFNPMLNPPRNLRSEAQNEKVLLKWDLPEVQSSNFVSIIAYNIYRNDEMIGTTIPDSLSYTDEGLHNFVNYEYFVKAAYNWDFNNIGYQDESDESNRVIAKPEDDMISPTNIEAFLIGNNILISWDLIFNVYEPTRGFLGFNLYKNDSFLTHTFDREYIDVNPVPDIIMVYNITALYDSGESEPIFSNPIFRPLYNPPTNLNIEIVNSMSFALTWNPPIMRNYGVIDHYRISKNGVFVENTTLLHYTDVSIMTDILYNYSIVAVYNNPSGESVEITAHPIFIPLQNPPLNLHVISSLSNKVELGWDAPISQNLGVVDSYTIYRDNQLLVENINSTSYIDLYLINDIEYEYHVVAVYFYADKPDYQGISQESNKIIVIPTIPPAPELAINPIPSNQLTNVPINQTLSWSFNQEGPIPIGYKLFFGTDEMPILVESNLSTTTWAPINDLLFGTTYYWQVVPFNDNGDATGCHIWSFTTIRNPEDIIVDTSNFNFGKIILGDTSISQSFVITNNGLESFTVNSISIDDNDLSEFSLLDSNTSSIVYPQDQMIFSIIFSPSTLGPKKSFVNISHDVSNTPYIFEISGIGVSLNPPRNIFSSMTNGVIKIEWGEPFPGGADLLGYKLLRDGIELMDDLVNEFLDNNVTYGIDYIYSIVAEYSNPLGTSLPISITVSTPVNEPITNLHGHIADNAINLFWTAPNSQSFGTISGYMVERNDILVDIVNTTYYHDFDVELGENYTYSVTVLYNNPVGSSTTVSTLISTPAVAPITNLQAIVIAGGINLTWTAPPTPVIGTLSGYRILRNNTELTIVTNTNYIDNDVTYSMNYQYAIVTLYSNPFAVSEAISTLMISTPPVLPITNPQANIISGSISLTWNAPPVQIFGNVAGYRIQRDAVDLTIITSTNYIDNAIEFDTTYLYSIYTVYENPIGESSSVSIGMATPTITPITDLHAFVAEGSIHLTWDPPITHGFANLIGYRITKNNLLLNTITNTNYIDSDVAFATNYQYSVVALYGNPNGESTPVSIDIFTPIPATITNLQAIVVSDHNDETQIVQLSWTAPQNQYFGTVSIYRILKNNVFLATSNSTQYEDNTVSVDTQYTYSIVALYENPTGETQQVDTTILVPKFSVPTNLIAEASDRSANLSWTAPMPQSFGTVIWYAVMNDEDDLIAIVPASATNYTIIGLINDTTYSFYVVAFYENPFGESLKSNYVSVTPSSLSEHGFETEIVKTELFGNYPNPFNPSTNIRFALEKECFISLDIYNIKGQKIKTLINTTMTKGKHIVEWNGRDQMNNQVSSGVYFYLMQTDDYKEIKRMLLVK